MKRKIVAGVLVLACLAASGCAANSIGPMQSRTPDVIVCGPAPSQSSPPAAQPPALMQARAIRALSVQEDPVPLDAETITILISNPTDEEMTFGEDYWLERQNEDGSWEKLAYLPDAAWHDIAFVIQPHSTGKHEIAPVYFYGKDALQPGHYRYGNQFDGETLYVEFDFVEPGDESIHDSDAETAGQALTNELDGLQKKGPDDPPSKPKPSKYGQPVS
ncbi:immunoglobulin-like domain-containing protein [Clostridium sp. D33t1_170424_F3]|uniref:immunoglobulin-like domain-containing protein n=1 Tax=Clostridium sp. D33t1_170424_F3 TaxID=2787099 RepID=UPI0018A9DAE6|nr:immunoglobulin-like domain-containing protein [Clostridium sp. D33t1_170424_F3]